MLKLRFLAGTVVSLVLLYLLFSSVSLGELLRAVGEADLLVLVPAIGLYFCGLWCRAWRWRVLLKAVQVLPTPMLFRTLVIGLAINDLLPLRLGELTRAALLKSERKVSFVSGLASIVVERILDGATLCLFLVVGLMLAPASAASGWLTPLTYVASAVFLSAVAGAVVTVVRPQLVRRAAARLSPRLPRAVGGALAGWVESALLGLMAVSRPPLILATAALSVAAWSLEAAMFYVVSLGFPLNAPAEASMLGMAAANLSSMVPSSPGYLGTFDLPLQRVLVEVYSVSAPAATSYTLVVHATLLLPVVLLGLALLWQADLSLGQLSRSVWRSPPADEAGARSQLPVQKG